MAESNPQLLPTVEPVFFKQKDIHSNQNLTSLTSYDVCIAVSRIVGQSNVDGAQNINGIWRIYLLSKESRVNLLVRGALTLMGRQVQLFDKNPTLMRDPTENIERLTIKDLPLSVSNSEIDAYLASKGLVAASNIKYTKARDENGGLTNFKTGDRFVFVKGPITPILPKKAQIADFNCRTYHDGQFQPNSEVCNTTGHYAGDSSCPSRNKGKPVTAFHSHKNIFSNFYPCNIEVDGTTFSSVEHGYQWYQAKDANLDDLAEQIMNAPHAGIAKKLSKSIPKDFRENWEEINIDKMLTLLQAKITQVPAFKAALIESSGSFLAESTPDRFWASGLSREVTEKADPKTWPGLNKLGHLMMEIRDNILCDMEKEENTSTTSQQSLGEEDTDCEFFNTHDDEIFTEESQESVTCEMTESISTLSANAATSSQITTAEKQSQKGSTSNPSKLDSESTKDQTQSRLRQQTLTEATTKGKPSSTSRNTKNKQGAAPKSNVKQGEKRKPSHTPEKDKMSKLMKVFTKK